MHKIGAVILGLGASIMATAVPGTAIIPSQRASHIRILIHKKAGLRSVGDLPVNPEVRDHTQG